MNPVVPFPEPAGGCFARPLHRLLTGLWVTAYAATLTLSSANDESPSLRAETSSHSADHDLEFQVLRAWRADFGDHAVVYRRVAPRALPPLPRSEPAPLTAAEAEALRVKAQKKHEILFLSCTVYDRRVTEMRWEHEGKRYRAYSNIDGNYLRGLLEFQTDDTVYWLMLGIGEETEEALKAAEAAGIARGWQKTPNTQLPALEEFANDRSEYIVAENSPEPPPAALVGLDALHAFFDMRKADLIKTYEEREAQRVAAEKWRAENPPVKEDMILNFWSLEDDAKFKASTIK